MNQQIDGYQDYSIEQEDVALYPEDGQRPAQGKCIVRVLNWFIFVKDGQPIAPVYSDGKGQSWSGTEVYGFAASLSGKARWHIMGGFWSYAWGEKQFELIHIKDIVGLSKEYSPHWRGGITPVLFLETGGGYAYALLDPATEYSPIWKVVCQSWVQADDGADPTYFDVDPAFPRPVWWAGTQSWNYVQRMLEEEKKRAEEDSDDELQASKRAKQKTPRRKASQQKSQKRKSNVAAESSFMAGVRKPGAGTIGLSPSKSVPRKKPRYVEINGDDEQDTPSRASTAISTVSTSMFGPILNYAVSIGALTSAKSISDFQAVSSGSAPAPPSSGIENQSVLDLELRSSVRHSLSDI